MTLTIDPTAQPRRLGADDADLPLVLTLIRNAFAYMDGIIDPPSSLHRMSLDGLRRQAAADEIWALGTPPVACMILTRKHDTLYLGKLATAAHLREQGLARRLIDHAAARAQDLGLTSLTLQTRVELVANHAAFRALGFVETARTRHVGYNRDTSITFVRSLIASATARRADP